jgi:hypothetical protein
MLRQCMRLSVRANAASAFDLLLLLPCIPPLGVLQPTVDSHNTLCNYMHILRSAAAAFTSDHFRSLRSSHCTPANPYFTHG